MSRAQVLTVDHYATQNLPEEIAGNIKATRLVRVKLEDNATQPRFMKFRGMAAHRNTSIAEAVARIRALRDDQE